MKYDFAVIEQRWQAYWVRQQTFVTPNPGDSVAGGFDQSKPKFYVLAMFPYPSGAGAHMGHALNYVSTDIVARYKKMAGYNVLHPIGFDAFGLPAEQYAVERGIHPRITTEQNIANLRAHFERLGLSFDWDRSLTTTDPSYYRWTQWIFLQMYHGWFDSVSNRARPITELEQMLNSEQLYVGLDGQLINAPATGLDVIEGTPIGATKWHELSLAQQMDVLNCHRLAYRSEVDVNWCPALGTVLANEEITNEGLSERGNYSVYKRPLRQWMLRITAYGQRLVKDLDQVDWPEPIKIMQRNWIGRSQGAMVDFAVDGCDELIQVFTTRPDTLFGATYMVLSPEHPLVDRLATDENREKVGQYQSDAAARSDVDRMAQSKTKTGVFTGVHAINPVNTQRIPIWIADYVMMGYGTGAIMAVPAHDERDLAFAKQYDLPISAVVMPDERWLVSHNITANDYADNPGSLADAFMGEGIGINSANDQVSLIGLATPDAKEVITRWLTDEDLGRKQVQYKLRDWLFSRQRYWGEPFPILYEPDGSMVPIEESELPLELPQLDDFKPHASDDPNAPVQTPLSRAPASWISVERDGLTYERELNTMPQWAGSCWYYLRFIDPKNHDRFVGKEAEAYWMVSKRSDGSRHTGGVDLYVGGVEHAVLHLLYARFWHKVLYDLGHVSTPEPFGRLYNQGYIQAYAYRDSRGIYVPADEVNQNNGEFFHNGQPVTREFGKMGKSLKNSVTPDHVCDQYGADTLRLFLMYLGPLDQSKLWNPRDIVGVHRFLQRLWRNFIDDKTGELQIEDVDPPPLLARTLHRTVKRVTDAMESMAFNVAIAAVIELNNDLVAIDRIPRQVAEKLVLCLAPMAPHICEELWNLFGNKTSVALQPWPDYDEAMLAEDQMTYPVQVNGKLRSRITVPAVADESAVEAFACADAKVRSAIEGLTIRKVIVVKDRMVNIVVQ